MAPNVMLCLDDDLAPEKDVTHPETGAEFTIVPLDMKTQQELLKAARGRGGVLDIPKHNGLIVDAAVKRWKGIGIGGKLAECTTENKKRFGARFNTMADWIYAQATSPLLFAEEVEEGKND